MYAQLKSFVGKINEAIKGWRTYITAGFIMVGSAIVEAADQAGTIDISAFLPARYAPLGPFLVALVMWGLRSITNTPPGKKA